MCFLNFIEKMEIERLLKESIQDDNILMYHRFMYDKHLYHSIEYGKMFKRNNSVVETSLAAGLPP